MFEIPGSHCTDAVATGKAIKVDAEHATVIEPGHVNLGTQRFVGDFSTASPYRCGRIHSIPWMCVNAAALAVSQSPELMEPMLTTRSHCRFHPLVAENTIYRLYTLIILCTYCLFVQGH